MDPLNKNPSQNLQLLLRIGWACSSHYKKNVFKLSSFSSTPNWKDKLFPGSLKKNHKGQFRFGTVQVEPDLEPSRAYLR